MIIFHKIVLKKIFLFILFNVINKIRQKYLIKIFDCFNLKKPIGSK